MKNFRQYKQEKIKFAHPEKEKNFTIIVGANGAGKTNLLNAITWCLYGEELHMGKKYKGLPILNMMTFEELDPGESCEVEVEIQMIDRNGQKILFTRNTRFSKTIEGKLQRIPDYRSEYPKGSTFVMMRQVGKDWVDVYDPPYIISRLMPKTIEEYFFFDGERLNEYFKGTPGEDIKEAVFRISQLGLLERVIDHLNGRKNAFIKTSRDLSSKAKEIRDMLDVQTRSLETDEEELFELRNEKAEAETEEEEYSAKLRGASAAEIAGLESQRIQIEEDLKGIDNQIKEIAIEKFDFLLEFNPSILLYEPLLRTREVISGRKEAGDIPPEYKKGFIEKLLKKGKCICGADISEGNVRRKKIENILKECSEISEISEELITLNAKVGSMLDRLRMFRKKQSHYSKRTKDLERERERKSKLFKVISEKIAKYDSEQIKLWDSKRQEWKRIKDELIAKIGVKEHQIQRRKNIIRAYTAQLKKELQKEDRYKELLRILDFCDESLKAAIEIRDGIMKDVKSEIEEKTKKQFLDLIWKKETYKDVIIDDNYNISVLHQSGMEGIGTLSAGERQVLALSFMAALNSVSGFDVPIIIDTPLGRISREPKRNIAENLPNYLKGTQVTMLVTEEEYTHEVRERLRDRVGKSYLIKFIETENGNLAEVVPYIE